MIELFCSKLPRDLSNQMYNEFSNRMKEVKYLLEYPFYQNLKSDIKTIEMFLALSIFYKRVILNLESATKFSGNVYKKSDAKSIRIGLYDLTPEESRRINAVVMNFKEILKNYSIPTRVIAYSETKVFLKELKKYKENRGFAENNNEEENG
jgi:hypothetical protein